MTNEEAIEVFKNDIEICTVQQEQACDVAIKALEQQPCEDCISRQYLIEKATSWDKHFADSERYVSLTDIQNAPSVTPKTSWTPVSELPKEQIKIGEYVFSENVLGTEGHTIRKAYYNYTTKEWFDGNEEMAWTEITHWMPLPEKLPKGGTNDG